MKKQAGFTIVELMVTMVIFLVVIAAASQIFTSLLTQFKQQSKIAETNIEGVIGLDILRRDIEHGGHGLPWLLNGAAYREIGNITATTWVDRQFSDGPPDNPARGCPTGTPCASASNSCSPNDPCSNPPGAFRSGDGAGTGGSDVLVIKAVNVSNAAVAHKWTYVSTGNILKEWDLTPERMVTDDRAIVMILGTNRSLVQVPSGLGSTFTARYNAGTSPDSLSNAAFAPLSDVETRVVYGVADAAVTDLRMPFNRADYYMRIPGTTESYRMPSRCAVGTGVLYKATVSQAPLPGTVDTTSELPLLDCVADMQVTYRLDANNDGTIDTDTNTIANLTAFQIREQLREIRVSILAHEGQRDPGYLFTNFTGGALCGTTCIRVGDSAVLGRDFNLAAITNFRNYRWKVYRIVVQPINLR